MNVQSCERHIAVLLKVRNACSSQLDDEVLSDLDRVISELQKARAGGLSASEAGWLALRVLQLIAVVVHLVTNISDLMK